MDKRRMMEWSIVGVFLGSLVMVDSGCAAGGGSSAGGAGGDDGTWESVSGSGTSSGMGGAGNTASSSSSGSGGPCSGPEVCNGKDDDCNGFVDDDPVDVGKPCNTGLMGVCGVGSVQCKDGATMCVQTNSETTEVCDNLDNDCNGSVDDGNPGGGDTCATGLAGACSLGELTCMAGAYSCAQKNQAIPEVCSDGVDNDCNGVVDDCGTMGGPCAHDPCMPGGPLAKECAPCVTVICNIDAYCCTTTWDLTCYTKALDMCPGC